MGRIRVVVALVLLALVIGIAVALVPRLSHGGTVRPSGDTASMDWPTGGSLETREGVYFSPAGLDSARRIVAPPETNGILGRTFLPMVPSLVVDSLRQATRSNLQWAEENGQCFFLIGGANGWRMFSGTWAPGTSMTIYPDNPQQPVSLSCPA